MTAVDAVLMFAMLDTGLLTHLLLLAVAGVWVREVARVSSSEMSVSAALQEMATAVYQQLQIWFDQFIYKR